jgi:hypothetical protein
MAHRHVHRRRRLGDAHQRRAAMAPDGDGHRVAGGARELVDALGGQPHRVVLLQADQAHLQRERAQAVAPALGLALDQAQLDEAHQVGVRLSGRHVGRGGEILQRQRLAVVRQREQQAAAHLDALDAARIGVARGTGRDGSFHGRRFDWTGFVDAVYDTALIQHW